MLGVFGSLAGQAFALSDENRPEYQQEYDAYLQDLEVIAQTGKAPANPDLEADLAKMSSNDKILLTTSAIVSSSSSLSSPLSLSSSSSSSSEPLKEEILAENDAQILNKVEIIRVPEEFQEEYADIYREEKGILKTPSLVKDTKKLSDKEAKVSEHQNPFQDKNNVKNVEDASDDSMFNAYFNPFSQPYVAGGSEQSSKPTEGASQSKEVSDNSSSSTSSSSFSSFSSRSNSSSSRASSQSRRNRKLTSSPIGVKNSMFVR